MNATIKARIHDASICTITGAEHWQVTIYEDRRIVFTQGCDTEEEARTAASDEMRHRGFPDAEIEDVTSEVGRAFSAAREESNR